MSLRRSAVVLGVAMLFAFAAAPAPAIATVYTGSIEFAPPPPPPPSFQPQPDPTTQSEYLHTATTKYDQASGDVTVTATVYNNAFWSNPYGGGPELFFRDFYLATACADSSGNVPYGATYISFTYGPGVPSGGQYNGFDSPPGPEPGGLTLDGVQGSLSTQSAFDGATYSITFQDPRLAGHDWTCSAVQGPGQNQPYAWYSYALHGPPKAPAKPPAKPPTRASLTSGNAALDFSTQLSSRYGKAWDNSTVPRSNPSPVCPQGIISGGSEGGSADCIAEFAYRGVWHLVSGTVSPRQDAVGDASINGSRTWTRRWRPMPCKGPGSNFPGTVSSNDAGCYQALFSQFFSIGGHYRFRFERHVYVLGTGTGYFRQFYTFNCSWSHKTYQCTNFFGDGFRWRPYA
jgi:hypothetical protein